MVLDKKNISSMNLNITNRLHLALCNTSSSKLAMNMLAKLSTDLHNII